VDYWPLLDIREALADCARTLAELVSLVETLQDETEAHYPPDAAHLLTTFAQMQALLGGAMTPALAAATAAEQAEYDEELSRWEASQP
jgi:hypothetical protein